MTLLKNKKSITYIGKEGEKHKKMFKKENILSKGQKTEKVKKRRGMKLEY